jgi:uncharacterized delta-60 repeat protein
VLLQPDGAIIVGGSSKVAGDFDFSVLRLLSNGSLDLSFSANGKETIPFGGEDFLTDMALQSNGKVVLVGEGDSRWGVARLNFDGTRDNGLSGDGKTIIDLEARIFGPDVALQPDGKIVISGWADFDTDDGYVARLTSTGNLDTSFDGDGILRNTQSTCVDVQSAAEWEDPHVGRARVSERGRKVRVASIQLRWVARHDLPWRRRHLPKLRWHGSRSLSGALSRWSHPRRGS